MEELRHFRSHMKTENPFNKCPNSFQTIPKNDIKGKMLRPQFRLKKFAAGRLPNLAWQFGQTSRDVQNVWDVARPRRLRRPQRPTSYIYIAPSQINSFYF